KAIEDARTRRLEFMATILTKITKPETTEIMARALVQGDYEPDFEGACRILGIETPPEEDSKSWRTFDDVSAIRNMAAEDGKLVRVALAIALATLDPSYIGDWTDPFT